jgi:hypothetical protein
MCLGDATFSMWDWTPAELAKAALAKAALAGRR